MSMNWSKDKVRKNACQEKNKNNKFFFKEVD